MCGPRLFSQQTSGAQVNHTCGLGGFVNRLLNCSETVHGQLGNALVAERAPSRSPHRASAENLRGGVGDCTLPARLPDTRGLPLPRSAGGSGEGHPGVERNAAPVGAAVPVELPAQGQVSCGERRDVRGGRRRCAPGVLARG